LVAAGSYALLEIEDTGSGIPPDVLPRIFEPFFTTRAEAGGTGLGLSTVQAIVRRCDGFLAVESVAGQGTRMRVYLPAWQGAADEAPAAAALPPDPSQPSLPFPEPPRLPRRAILLVDDEDVVRRVTERALARQGWRVLAAPNAEAALQLLAPEPPPTLAAMVSDLAMPGMDGADLVHAVRQRLGRPGLPTVLISGYVGGASRETMAAPGEGETRFLAKPYNQAELASLLTELAL
jgi:two-component system cell cycle sensor histidine kinase/response regulator CckA